MVTAMVCRGKEQKDGCLPEDVEGQGDLQHFTHRRQKQRGEHNGEKNRCQHQQ